MALGLKPSTTAQEGVPPLVQNASHREELTT